MALWCLSFCCGWALAGGARGVEGSRRVPACEVDALGLAQQLWGGGLEDVQAVGVGGEDAGLSGFGEFEVAGELFFDLAVGEEQAPVGGVVVGGRGWGGRAYRRWVGYREEGAVVGG